MIVKKSVIRKEVKSTNEEETRKKRIMIFNLKNKTGKSDVECVKDVFGKMGAGQSCDDVVDVVRLRQKENGPIIRPIIVEFRSEYDKWTVMRMKAKLRECEEYRSVFFRDGSVEGRERGKEGKSNEAERRENTEREATGVNGMATEKRSIAVVWKNVRKMRSRERQSEIMDWIERSNCDICAVNETGLTGEEYMEVSDGYSWFAANREWTKGRSGGAGFIIKKGIRCEEMIDKMEDVCLVKIGRSDHKFEWLVGSVYMNCEGVRKEENILKLEYIKAVVWRALDDGLGIMIGGDMNGHIWELDGCENDNGQRMKENMNEIGLQIASLWRSVDGSHRWATGDLSAGSLVVRWWLPPKDLLIL